MEKSRVGEQQGISFHPLADIDVQTAAYKETKTRDRTRSCGGCRTFDSSTNDNTVPHILW